MSQAAGAASLRDLRRRPSQSARRFRQEARGDGVAAFSPEAQKLAAEAAADAAAQAGPAGWLPAALNLPAAVRAAAVSP